MRLVPALAAVLTAVGLGTVGGASVVDPAGAAEATSHLTPGPGDETTVLDRAELFAAVEGDPDHYTATLYFVTEDGAWFHAFPNGSIGAPAPDGDEIPQRSGETYDVSPDERPRYLWKVVSDDECSTTFYDAENASDVAPLPIPNCPPHARPTPPETSLATAGEPGAGTPTTTTQATFDTTRETTTSGQPGFGIALTVVSLVGAGWGALGRR